MVNIDKIRVLVVDDYEVLRKGIVQLLSIQSQFEVVGEAVNGQMAVELTDEKNPDIILMDIQMPVLDGISAAKEIRKKK